MAPRKRTYKTVQVCVSPERHAELKDLAEAERVALSRLVGDLIEEALKYRRKGRAKMSEETESDKIRRVLEIYKALQDND